MSAIRPAIYVTNLAAVCATRRRGGRSGPAVGTGPVLGIMRRPPAWARRSVDGHVPALMPTADLLTAARLGRLGFEQYCANLRRQWSGNLLAPGLLDRANLLTADGGELLGEPRDWDGDRWLPRGAVPPNSTLVCTCAVGEPCHRQLAADLLAQAGWWVVLDGQGIEHRQTQRAAKG